MNPMMMMMNFLSTLTQKLYSLVWTLKVQQYTRDYANLPSDVVAVILDKLLEPIDHARLTKRYRYEIKPWVRLNQTPMLFIPMKKTSMLYSLSESTFYRKINFPMPSDHTQYVGFNWIATLTLKLNEWNQNCYKVLVITLKNPFKISKYDGITLPPIPYPNSNPKVKIILPTDPILGYTKSCIVLVICDSTLYSFISSGMWDWKTFNDPSNVASATYHQGRLFFTVSEPYHRLFEFTEYFQRYHEVTVPIPVGYNLNNGRTYLVTSKSGDLLVIKRWSFGLGEERFKVFELVKSDQTRPRATKEVVDIGNESIFISDNHSFSVLISKFGRPRSKLQPNSIYYTSGGTSKYIGVYNIKDGTITKICPHKNRFVQAIWIAPPFREGKLYEYVDYM